MLCGMAGFQPQPPVECQQERGEMEKCLLDTPCSGDEADRADQRIGDFFGMVDDAAAGYPPNCLDSVGASSFQLDNLFRFLEAAV